MPAVSHIEDEYAAIADYWSPRVVAAANGQYVKLAKAKGEFVWHAHAEEDEFFMVHRGTLTIRYRDREDAVLGPGDFHVVPKGVEHAPMALEEAWIMLIEPAGTAHTGDVDSPMTKSIASQTRHLG
ncbi:MAG: cupin domain-containing protein [Phenylobacterium sp.]|uniref:cupin domain-containing protein n=1 Tax=Phenylobacterium sp. TaxID=1871053 RepID=UPI00273414CD|nr:cupin domain-containing protein [Phenylobacterium sp.]MDP3750199.1 cupin domain-containing protein [Phenylobacterium sp.]